MSSPSVKGSEWGLIVESAAIFAGDNVVEDSENVVEGARPPVASSGQFTNFFATSPAAPFFAPQTSLEAQLVPGLTFFFLVLSAALIFSCSDNFPSTRSDFLLGGFPVRLVVPVYSSSLSVSLVAGDVQGAVAAEDLEGEDVVEGASEAVLAGDGETVEADNLEISCVDFGSYVFVSLLIFSFLLDS